MINPFFTKTILVALAIPASTATIHFYARPISPEISSSINNKLFIESKNAKVIQVEKMYVSDYDKFIKEANQKINTNEARITTISKKLIVTSANNKLLLNHVSDLNSQNELLKSKILLYNSEGSGNWKLFQAYVNTSTDQISQMCDKLEN